ncbi:MAG TPA: hypothetical protein VEB19_17250 [Gemmatimonadaceae bacterium]|nr:hypothetical protein [Gemmatimonadaceae bacterium]
MRNQALLDSATEQLQSLTDGEPADDARRAAIAWGYAERLRLGLESPFRLVESAARDARLTAEERRTVSWALLARIVDGGTHVIDAAVFDHIGPSRNGHTVRGEHHLALIDSVIVGSENPRAGELAIRLAYTLASTERIVDAVAPLLAAEAAALTADREIARREAVALVRGSSGTNPIAAIERRRAQRTLYVERPVLMALDSRVEEAATYDVPGILSAIRALDHSGVPTALVTVDDAAVRFSQELLDAGSRLPPAAALAVTVQRYVPMVAARATAVDVRALRSAHNAEMLIGAITTADSGRQTRRVVGRLMLAAAVAQRSSAQDAVLAPSDSALVPSAIASATGVASISFDRDVPLAWRSSLLRAFADGVRELRRVLPTLDLALVQVRFRMTAPADSALAMHDPRTRTLHLPVTTAGGTLLHEIAHELDRQSAAREGLAGYRSDLAARTVVSGKHASTARVATSLRALTEDVTNLPRISKATERPAEIFATQVDWFVAQALAKEGRSSGFLTGVQDELLTGHVVHPERLRSSGRSRSLLDALEAMTAVAPRARAAQDPSLETLLRWALNGPVDRRAAAAIVRGPLAPWSESLSAIGTCELEDSRAMLVRLAADSRARGWLSQRARWMAEEDRPAWARAALRQAPWDPASVERRVAELRDHVLVQLVSNVELPAGLGAYAAPTAARARCS